MQIRRRLLSSARHTSPSAAAVAARPPTTSRGRNALSRRIPQEISGVASGHRDLIRAVSAPESSGRRRRSVAT